MVPVAVRLAKVRLPEMIESPWTEKREEGVVVPMPTLPLSWTVKMVEEALFTISKLVLAPVPPPQIVRRA